MPIQDLRDVRPPVDLPPNYFLLFLVLAVFIIAAVGVVLWWLKKKFFIKKVPAVIIRPAWEIAKEELAALQGDSLPAQGKVEQYFVRLSGIIRHYLERRFSVSAPEMTTDEFLTHMKTMPILDEQQKMSLKEFLTLSDMVKFARYSSTSKEMADAFAVAARLIEETTPTIETLQPEQ